MRKRRRDHRATDLKSFLLRSLAAASDLEQEQEDGSQEASPKSSNGAWRKNYTSSQTREPGQGHHRPANAFTVVFPRRKSGQSCRIISRECPFASSLEASCTYHHAISCRRSRSRCGMRPIKPCTNLCMHAVLPGCGDNGAWPLTQCRIYALIWK
jgi:hypothetical protein